MEKKPTIKTIAKLAGVSHVAVSKALHDAPDISSETKARILQIAKEIDYTPSVIFNFTTCTDSLWQYESASRK